MSQTNSSSSIKEPKGWFKRLTAGLKKTSSKLSDGITAILVKRKLDQQVLDQLEELLITADIGVVTSQKIIADLKSQRFNQDVSDQEVREFLAQEIEKILQPVALPVAIHLNSSKPLVILMIGVNGSGKTTTIGKLAKHWQHQGYSIHLAAGDTFRAAASAQLEIWAQRLNITMTVGAENADPAGLAYQALQNAKANKADILLIDTAGRLHNKDNLMAELTKIKRVIAKIDPTAPHHCILVLDATIGQNSYNQVKTFSEIAGVTGLIMTKLDGTARGGVLIGLTEKFKLPIHAIGVGEHADDLQNFDAGMFAKSLMNIDQS